VLEKLTNIPLILVTSALSGLKNLILKREQLAFC